MPTLATRRACLDWPRLTIHVTGQTWDGSLLVAPPPSQPQPGVRWEQRHWQPDWLVCLMVGVFCGGVVVRPGTGGAAGRAGAGGTLERRGSVRCEVFGERGQCRRDAIVVVEWALPKYEAGHLACCWQHAGPFVEGDNSRCWDPAEWEAHLREEGA